MRVGRLTGLTLVVLALVAVPPAGAGADTITTVAGGGSSLGDGGPATAAQLNDPRDVALKGGGYLIADRGNRRIRFVDAAGVITTVAGDGSQCTPAGAVCGDGGAATAAQLSAPVSVSVMDDGGYLIADESARRIRRVSPLGTISTVAGNGLTIGGGDGLAATTTGINNPGGVAALSGDDFLIAETPNGKIRKVTAGIIGTVAGGGASLGDGGQATAALMVNPTQLSTIAGGGYLIADLGDQRVRMVSGGTISTVAGTGAAGFAGDGGPATSATLDKPSDVVPLSDGGFLVTEVNNARVRRVAAGGTITTVAGGGPASLSLGDGGPATSGMLAAPRGIVVNAGGGIYIADSGHGRVRYVAPASGVSTPASTPTSPPSPGPAAAVDRQAPLLSGLAVRPKSFRAATRGSSVVRTGGAAVSYTLSEAARVVFRVQREVDGRRAGSRCVTRTAKNRKKPKCTILKAISGSFTDAGEAGANSLRFSGRVAGHSLAPGAYVITATATDSAGNIGKPSRAAYGIKPPK